MFRFLHQVIIGLTCLFLLCSCNFTSTSINKSLTVATEPAFPHFEFQTSSGDLQGFDIDLMQAIAKVANFNVKFQSLPFDGIIPALQARTIDAAISGITITSERQKTVSFSRPYFQAGLAIAVRADHPNITNLDQLKNRTIAVQIGTTGAQTAKQIPGATIRTFDSSPLALQALINGNVEAVINDAPVTLYAIKNANLKVIKIAGKLLTKEYYGIATAKNSPDLSNLNQGLIEILQNGTYTQIYQKWFNRQPPELPPEAIANLTNTNSAKDISSLNIILTSLPFLLQGVLVTILLTAISIVIGTLCGSIIGILRLSPYGILRFIARVYIDFFRGTPLLVQIFMIYFGLPALAQNFGLTLTLQRLPAAVIALSLNCAAYIAEIVRGGIQSIELGQTEAAKSLGLSPIQTMYHVIFPQAFRRMLPPLGNEFITLLKDTSLVAVIGFEELFRRGQLIVADNYRSFEIYGTVALFYLALTLLASQGFSFWERWMNPIRNLDK